MEYQRLRLISSGGSRNRVSQLSVIDVVSLKPTMIKTFLLSLTKSLQFAANTRHCLIRGDRKATGD